MAIALSAGQIAGLIGGSSLLSFGGNLATSALNSSRAWKYTQRAMQYQDQLNRAYFQWSSENGPSFSRKGYEQAGYNPLLALGSNLSGNSAIYSGSAPNSDSDNGSQAVEAGLNSALAMQDLPLKVAQRDNIDADTDVKKYGEKVAHIKNIAKLIHDNKDNPIVTKALEGEIVGMSNNNSALSSFKNNHPTTFTVLRKLKQGDFKGAKYAMDLRRQRIKNKNSHSAKSSRPPEISPEDWYGDVSSKSVWR